MNSSDSEEMMMFSSDSSDEEDELLVLIAIEEEEAGAVRRSRQRGSMPGHAVIDRQHREGAARLYNDYFADNPVYGDVLFRRRFRMSRRLFLHIAAAVEEHDTWFRQRRDATGKLGLSPLQKMTAAIRLIDGTAPPVSYSINGNRYDMGYYLGDGIYPEWATIVKAISAPRGNKSIHFSAMQAALRKDVERAFGVLQARFAIVRGPARVWDQSTLHNIMTVCVIMHNMIIEDERGTASPVQVFDFMGEPTQVHRSGDEGVLHYVETTQAIRNRAVHCQLRADLVEHLWSIHGAQ
ncbi:uncharacterized protein LOC133907585 [Phragmites australis]|uniref:uncharacterized protein LOC133907585 n=1 Tax=Phragmites australis TaxID=29695 RepID=UPI002D78EAC3|nr:uncharacterized protein LOC133907585 [Phragmites australis]